MTTVSEQHDMCCPQCKSDTDLTVAAAVVAKLTPDGVVQHGDWEWGSTSGVHCENCGFDGEVLDFAVVEYPVQAVVAEVRKLVASSPHMDEPTRLRLRRLLRHFDEDGEPNS